jgi:hypothetical protein
MAKTLRRDPFETLTQTSWVCLLFVPLTALFSGLCGWVDPSVPSWLEIGSRKWGYCHSGFCWDHLAAWGALHLVFVAGLCTLVAGFGTSFSHRQHMIQLSLEGFLLLIIFAVLDK